MVTTVKWAFKIIRLTKIIQIKVIDIIAMFRAHSVNNMDICDQNVFKIKFKIWINIDQNIDYLLNEYFSYLWGNIFMFNLKN